MKERFNLELWSIRLREAIDRRDGDRMAELLYENDGNGCFSYDAVCFEFGETSVEEWIDGLVECGSEMLSLSN